MVSAPAGCMSLGNALSIWHVSYLPNEGCGHWFPVLLQFFLLGSCDSYSEPSRAGQSLSLAALGH